MNITNENWVAEHGRKPELREGDTLLYSECGRILHHVDYRSHWFVLCKDSHGSMHLLVRHGGGDERTSLTNFYRSDKHFAFLDRLDSDERYLLFHQMHRLIRESEGRGRATARDEYRQAFVDGRLRKRKYPNQTTFKVWVEPQILRSPAQ